jgi:hypothetical protein
MCRLTALISGGAWSEKPKKCGACHRRDGRPLFAQIVLYSLTLLSCSLRGLLSVLALSSTRASRLALYSLALTLRMFLIALYFDPFRVLLPAHPVGSEYADVDRSLLRSTLRLALGSPEPPCSQLAHLVRPLANRRSLLRQPAFLLSALIHSTCSRLTRLGVSLQMLTALYFDQRCALLSAHPSHLALNSRTSCDPWLTAALYFGSQPSCSPLSSTPLALGSPEFS